MSGYQIILFYTYVHIANPEVLAKELKGLQERLGITGRTIIAFEGINATLEGTTEQITEFLSFFLSDPRFAKTHIKRSAGMGNAFPKCSVKVREEIVTSGCSIDPRQVTGKRLSPEELHTWLRTGKEFYIIDMRNAYEHAVGYFEGSIKPAMDNFRDLPLFIESLSHLKDKVVLTVCTGGVRCEKASGYLLSQGFSNVYQLDGGIVSYMEKYPNQDFVGKLYVFDNRMLMGFYTDDPSHTIVGRCIVCCGSCERFTNCHNHDCHRQVLACENCERQSSRFICKTKCKEKTRSNSLLAL